MGSPCEPLTPRQELISELESYGFDVDHGAPENWRDVMSDDDMRITINRLNNEA
ncbi:hypothetical protein [Mesorhizobium sp. GbtcB19]|uniref:hypothetical protein n=1 Tax=Mesorhizobium sp. GbtcB19 TaxID=2824764 RepID=UPI001C300286|nr:hypothetical protein [Mesorhizobium sp. GbtcB19]